MTALDVLYILWTLSTLAEVLAAVFLYNNLTELSWKNNHFDESALRQIAVLKGRIELLEKLGQMSPEDRAVDQAAKEIATAIEKDLFSPSLPTLAGLSTYLPEPTKTEATTSDALNSTFGYYNNKSDDWEVVLPTKKTKKRRKTRAARKGGGK